MPDGPSMLKNPPHSQHSHHELLSLSVQSPQVTGADPQDLLTISGTMPDDLLLPLIALPIYYLFESLSPRYCHVPDLHHHLGPLHASQLAHL